MTKISELIEESFKNRSSLIEKLHAEETNSYRLFHGINEGWQGLTVDRYGDLVLAQTFREPLEKEEIDELEEILLKKMEILNPGKESFFVYNHRGVDKEKGMDYWYKPTAKALETQTFKEMGLKYINRARHRGQDPYLFLDMRAGRRFVKNNCKGLTLLNLFSYTNATGVAAMAGGAKEVLNVDFSESALTIGDENGKINGYGDPVFRSAKSDVFAALRQLSGTPFKGRKGVEFKRPDVTFKQRTFDLVFLDPPAWSKSPFGTIDLIRDYQSIFKLSLLATSPGGRVIAVNNVAKVNLEEWLEILRRCGAKAGIEIKGIEVIQPEADFPSPDKNFPLKIAVCQI